MKIATPPAWWRERYDAMTRSPAWFINKVAAQASAAVTKPRQMMYEIRCPSCGKVHAESTTNRWQSRYKGPPTLTKAENRLMDLALARQEVQRARSEAP